MFGALFLGYFVARLRDHPFVRLGIALERRPEVAG
jgi:hypothetical protein